MGYYKENDETKICYRDNKDILNLKNEIEIIHSNIRNTCLIESNSTREDILELSKKLDRIISKYNSKEE